MFTTLLAISTAAEAGCALDEDRDARWAAAPLIVEGVITDLIIRDGAVLEYLQVHTTHKGLLATDGLWLRTQFPHAGCARPIVYAPGAAVYAVGAPDDQQSIDISPCRPDVGLVAALSEDLAAVAAQQPQTAGRFLGADWQRAFSPLPPLTDADDGLRAVLSRDGVRYRSRLLARDGDVLSLLVDAGDLELLFRARTDELLPVVTTDWPLRAGSGLSWRAGTAAGDALPPAWSDAPPIPPEAIGSFWTPQEAEPPETRGVFLAPGPVVLWDAPDGAPLLRWAVAPATAAQQVGQAPGWRQLWIETDTLVGTAWVEQAALAADASYEGGVAGGVIGGSLGSHVPIRVPVPAGVVLSRDDGAALGRTVRATSLKYLADDGERAWVAVAWPAGELVATVPCAPEPAAPCTIAAP